MGFRAARSVFTSGDALPLAIVLDDPALRVRLRVDRRARRFTLRLASDGEGAVLTLPPSVGEAAARQFLTQHASWLRDALARQPSSIVVDEGAMLPVDGQPRRVTLDQQAPRLPELTEGHIRLRPGSAIGPRLERWLRARARARFEPVVMGYAHAVGRRCTGLKIADTRSRWGSCSSTGRIGLSWRLAMAPEAIQTYVAAHEAAHLVEMNHSQRYWAVLAGIMPDYAAKRAWLKREGRRLHAYRFEIASQHRDSEV
ncbi:MAG: SprT family zinc-dependent metalloprotease [Pseudomonadota bacterium]